MSFDDKFKTLYSSFEMTKSKLGRQSVSPQKSRYQKRDSLDLMADESMEMTRSKPFYFERDPQEKSVPEVTSSKLNNPEF